MSSTDPKDITSANKRSSEWETSADDSLENLFNDSNEESGAVNPENALQLWDESMIERYEMIWEH